MRPSHGENASFMRRLKSVVALVKLETYGERVEATTLPLGCFARIGYHALI